LKDGSISGVCGDLNCRHRGSRGIDLIRITTTQVDEVDGAEKRTAPISDRASRGDKEGFKSPKVEAGRRM
jgi:hypothetical protein